MVLSPKPGCGRRKAGVQGNQRGGEVVKDLANDLGRMNCLDDTDENI